MNAVVDAALAAEPIIEKAIELLAKHQDVIKAVVAAIEGGASKDDIISAVKDIVRTAKAELSDEAIREELGVK